MSRSREMGGTQLTRGSSRLLGWTPRRVPPSDTALAVPRIAPPFDTSLLWDWWEPSRELYADNDTMPVLHGLLHGQHWTQVTSSYYPTFKTAIINSLAVSRHVLGATPKAWTGPSMKTLKAAHLFIIVKINNDPPASATKTGLVTLGSSGSNSHYPFTDGSIYDDSFSTTRQTVGNPTPALTSWRLYEIISTTTEWTALLDGTQLFTTATNTPSFLGNNLTTLGTNLGSLQALEGDIAGVYMFVAKLGSERTEVVNYINARFNQSFS